VAAETNLLGIPVELLDNIAVYVDPEDLLSLRLVHAKIRDTVQKRYLQEYYTQRSFLLSSEMSLNRMFELAKMPDHVAYLRKIGFSVARPSPRARTRSVFIGNRPTEREKGMARSYWAHSMAFSKEGRDLDLLTYAFARARSSGLISPSTTTGWRCTSWRNLQNHMTKPALQYPGKRTH
jgi:hypothetical protein